MYDVVKRTSRHILKKKLELYKWELEKKLLVNIRIRINKLSEIKQRANMTIVLLCSAYG